MSDRTWRVPFDKGWRQEVRRGWESGSRELEAAKKQRRAVRDGQQPTDLEEFLRARLDKDAATTGLRRRPRFLRLRVALRRIKGNHACR